jgi:hypothetical protein
MTLIGRHRKVTRAPLLVGHFSTLGEKTGSDGVPTYFHEDGLPLEFRIERGGTYAQHIGH